MKECSRRPQIGRDVDPSARSIAQQPVFGLRPRAPGRPAPPRRSVGRRAAGRSARRGRTSAVATVAAPTAASRSPARKRANSGAASGADRQTGWSETASVEIVLVDDVLRQNAGDRRDNQMATWSIRASVSRLLAPRGGASRRSARRSPRRDDPQDWRKNRQAGDKARSRSVASTRNRERRQSADRLRHGRRNSREGQRAADAASRRRRAASRLPAASDANNRIANGPIASKAAVA